MAFQSHCPQVRNQTRRFSPACEQCLAARQTRYNAQDASGHRPSLSLATCDAKTKTRSRKAVKLAKQPRGRRPFFVSPRATCAFSFSSRRFFIANQRRQDGCWCVLSVVSTYEFDIQCRRLSTAWGRLKPAYKNNAKPERLVVNNTEVGPKHWARFIGGLTVTSSPTQLGVVFLVDGAQSLDELLPYKRPVQRYGPEDTPWYHT